MSVAAEPYATALSECVQRSAMTDEDWWAVLDSFIETAVVQPHFNARELVPLGRATKGVRLKRPPVVLWQNIVPTLHVLEWLRSELGGHPIHVNSGYRDSAYNNVVGGAGRSLHKAFNAADIRSDHASPVEIASLLHRRYPAADRLGIGWYRDRFVHLDTRGYIGRPAPARWPKDGPW